MKKIICLVILLIFILQLSTALVSAYSDINLAYKKNYSIEYDSPIENGFPNLVHKDEDKKLTDGIKAKENNIEDDRWLVLYRGTALTVTIDLGIVCAVKSVSLEQLQAKSEGVFCARYVHVAVSVDGKKFGTVGSRCDEKSITLNDNTKIKHAVSFDKYYKARYVRLIFSNDVWGFVDEIEVFGTTDSSVGINATVDKPTEYPNAFCSDIDGLENILLMYSGRYNRGQFSNIGMNSYNSLLPYFAYINTNGQPVDTLFDGMLFLPLNPGSSSANIFSFSKKTGWQIYLDSIIGTADNVNITALNKLVGDYKEQFTLGSDYKYPIYISVPYIELSDNVVFGDIDGKTITPSNLENRVKIVKWFVDSIISSFNAAGFKNIQLNGMYWHHELVPYHISEHEDNLIKAYNDYVHTKGLSSIWIPYYCAPGFETWRELGFDAATLQSGYAFIGQGSEVVGEKLPGVVNDSLTQAKKYGLGMEVETDGNLNGNEEGFNRYNTYLHTAYINGITKKGLTMYYQGGGPGVFYQCAYSYNPRTREAYDLTYRFIKKTYFSIPDKIASRKYIIDDVSGYIGNVADNTSVMRFLSDIYGNAHIKIFNGLAEVKDDVIIGTGMSVKLYDGSTVKHSLKVIVYGDIDGDGMVSAKDYLLTKRTFLNTYTLSEVQLRACCMEGTALPTAKDYLKIKRHFLGTYNLYD
ncbi:MAG: hypothetical protein CVU97_00770 [Firmicutes bacterium HGW-Firmicutes-21]|nr:MAG: hypothetical protein CVU97_00770 [Firmicutes bacterium HGW-Firmicutes-21]